jgi:hypothetical protein
VVYFPTYESAFCRASFWYVWRVLGYTIFGGWLCTRYPEQPNLYMISPSSTIPAPLTSLSIMTNDLQRSLEHSEMFLPSFLVHISIGRKPIVGTESGISACTQQLAGHKPLMSNPPNHLNQASLHMICSLLCAGIR